MGENLDATLRSLLDEGGPVPSDAALGAIVERRRRRSVRRSRSIAAASLAVAVVASGVAASLVVRGSPATRRSTVHASARKQVRVAAPGALPLRARRASAAGATASVALVPASLGVPAHVGYGAASPVPSSLTRLFTEAVSTTRVRAFLAPAPAAAARAKGSGTCPLAGALLVEASDPGAVGGLEVPEPARGTAVLRAVGEGVVGAAERDAFQLVGLLVDPSVASVQAVFADGARVRAEAIDDWVVLVDHPRGANALADGTGPVDLTLRSASGRRLGTVSLPAGASLELAGSCFSQPAKRGTGTRGS